jgi:hypothetical protein
MSVDELDFGFRELAKKLYSEEATLKRRRAFFGRQRALAVAARAS